MEKQTAVQQASNFALSFAFTPMQWAILGVCGFLILMNTYKWLSRKPTGATQVIGVLAIPVLLYAANFLSLPHVN